MARFLFISAESIDDRMPTRVTSIAQALARKGDCIILYASAGQYTLGRPAKCFLRNLLPHVDLSGGVIWVSPPTLRLATALGALKVTQSLFNTVSAILFMLLTLAWVRVDAIYCSTAQTQGLLGSVLNAISRKSLVVDYGDPSFARDSGSVRRFGSILEIFSMARCDAVISADPVISEYIQQNNGRTPTFIPNGFDPSLFSPRLPRQPRKKRNLVTFVGKIDTSVYRLDILLNASRRVIAEVPDAKFRFVGVGPDLVKLKKLVEGLRIETSVKFVGSVPHENIAAWMRESKACIHLTNDTCLGQKVMEYMASGSPAILASPWWRKYKVLLKNGYNCVLVPLDAVMVATAILKVMRNERFAARLSINGFNTARRHTWDNIRLG